MVHLVPGEPQRAACPRRAGWIAPPCLPRGSPMGQELPGRILHPNARILPPPCQPHRGHLQAPGGGGVGPQCPQNEGRRLGRSGRGESTSSSYLAADFNNHNPEDWSQIAGGERPRRRELEGTELGGGARWGERVQKDSRQKPANSTKPSNSTQNNPGSGERGRSPPQSSPSRRTGSVLGLSETSPSPVAAPGHVLAGPSLSLASSRGPGCSCNPPSLVQRVTVVTEHRK